MCRRAKLRKNGVRTTQNMSQSADGYQKERRGRGRGRRKCRHGEWSSHKPLTRHQKEPLLINEQSTNKRYLRRTAKYHPFQWASPLLRHIAHMWNWYTPPSVSLMSRGLVLSLYSYLTLHMVEVCTSVAMIVSPVEVSVRRGKESEGPVIEVSTAETNCKYPLSVRNVT